MILRSIGCCSTFVVLLCFTNRLFAGTVVYDAFENGETTAPWESKVELRFENDSMILTGGWHVFADINSLDLDDTSIRARVRLNDSGAIYVAARERPSDVINYYGGISASSAYVGIGGISGSGNLATAPVDFDVTQEDIMIQLDVIAEDVSFWAWRPGQPMPSVPLLAFNDETIIRGDIFVGAVSQEFLADSSEIGLADAEFRFVHVADEPIRDLFGDFDFNSIRTANDIDLLSMAINMPPADISTFDLNQDGQLSRADQDVWVHELMGAWFGDSNLDGEFNSGDLISASAAGTYESDLDAGWASGDFDGSGRFDSGDLILALADGGYEQGPRAAATSVPEATTVSSLLTALIAIAGVSKGRRKAI